MLSRLAGACHQTGRYREELQFLSLLTQGTTGDVAVALENRRKEAESLAAEQAGAIDETLIDFLHLEGEEPLPEEIEDVAAPVAEPAFEAPSPGEANGSDRVTLGEKEDQAASRESEIELIIEDDRVDEAGPVVTVEHETEPAAALEAKPAEAADAAEPAADAPKESGDAENDIRE